MKKTKLKIKLPAIRSREDADAALGDIALTSIRQIQLTAHMDAKIAQVRKLYETQLTELAATLEAKTEALREWAEANPALFEKRKSIELTHGVLGFRTGTPKLALLSRKWNWSLVLAAVKHVLPGFIRNTPEVDKEALIAQREHAQVRDALPLCGIKVVQDETFYVEPELTAVETRQISEVVS